MEYPRSNVWTAPPRILRANTYILPLQSSTIPDAVCSLLHEMDKESSAYCIRHHPHDKDVELHVCAEALPAVAAEIVRLMDQCVAEPGASPLECIVQCPSFWTANILRRVLLTCIRVTACSSVNVSINTSGQDDWQIAHRFGQLARDCIFDS